MSELAVMQANERVDHVELDGLALLKIVKHCHESLPQMVTGSLLGLCLKGKLQITHAFPFPNNNNNNTAGNTNNTDADTETATATTSSEDDYQLEMMRMLREVNVDNNCVGWYQSMYLGSFATPVFCEHQFSYQTDLSPHAVVLLYDPLQTSKGNLVLQCRRLSQAFLNHQRALNEYYQQSKNATPAAATTPPPPPFGPKDIFEIVPMTFTQPGLARAWLTNVQFFHANRATFGGSTSTTATATTTSKTRTSGGDKNNKTSAVGANHVVGSGSIIQLESPSSTVLDRLDVYIQPYLEKHLEFLSTWVDDLDDFYKTHVRQAQAALRNNKGNKQQQQQQPAQDWNKMESLLMTHQIETYCNQLSHYTKAGFTKTFMLEGLYKTNNNNDNNNNNGEEQPIDESKE